MGVLRWIRDRALDFLTGVKLDRVTTVDPYEHSVAMQPVISDKGYSMQARPEEVTRPDIPSPPPPPLAGSLQDRLRKARKQ